MLAPYIEAHDRGPLLDLGVRSLGLYDEWSRRSRTRAARRHPRRIGTLEVALDPDHARELHRTSLHSRDPVRRWMTPDEARQSRPALGGLIAGALFTPSHGYVSAHQLTHALARAAEHAGARFRQATVQTIAPGRASLTVHTSDGNISGERGAGGRRVDQSDCHSSRGRSPAATRPRTTPSSRMAGATDRHDPLGARVLYRPAPRRHAAGWRDGGGRGLRRAHDGGGHP